MGEGMWFTWHLAAASTSAADMLRSPFPRSKQQLWLWIKWAEPGIAKKYDLVEDASGKVAIMYAAVHGLLKFKRNMIEIK